MSPLFTRVLEDVLEDVLAPALLELTPPPLTLCPRVASVGVSLTVPPLVAVVLPEPIDLGPL